MYCLCVGVDKFGFKPLLGLEPMAPIRPQLLVSHANHSATETSICMYVCVYVRMETVVKGRSSEGLICPIFYKDKNTNTPCPLGRTPMDRSVRVCVWSCVGVGVGGGCVWRGVCARKMG